MKQDSKAAIEVLNDLIETCMDGVSGFRTAVSAVKSVEAKQLFNSRIKLIESAESELRAEVRNLGGEPAKTGSVAAKIHRGWMDIKEAVTGKDEAAITTECERGELVAVKNYEEALKKDLPSNVRTMVERQHKGTVQNLERVRALGKTVGAKDPVVAPHPNVERQRARRS